MTKRGPNLITVFTEGSFILRFINLPMKVPYRSLVEASKLESCLFPLIYRIYHQLLYL